MISQDWIPSKNAIIVYNVMFISLPRFSVFDSGLLMPGEIFTNPGLMIEFSRLFSALFTNLSVVNDFSGIQLYK